MKKKFALTSLIIMICLFVGGLVLLINSPAIAQKEGYNALQAHGGSMDGNRYDYIINSATENYRTAGMVISLVGGFGLLISGYAVYQEI